MSRYTTIIVLSAALMLTTTSAITWNSINLHRSDNSIYQGEYVHFLWNSTESESCVNVEISMLNASDVQVETFTHEREPGHTKYIWKCLPAGQYKFRIRCNTSDDVSALYSVSSVQNNMLYYQRAPGVMTWKEQVAYLEETNVSVYTVPQNVLVKSVLVSLDNGDNKEISFDMLSSQGYVIRAEDKCGMNIGEEEFSSENLLELEPEPTLAPTPVPTFAPTQYTPTPEPTSVPTSGSTPEPTPTPAKSSAFRTVVSLYGLIMLGVFF